MLRRILTRFNAAHPDPRRTLPAAEHSNSSPISRKPILASPRDARIFCDPGNTLRELGRYDEAFDAYAKSLENDPQLAEAHFSRAFVQLLQGDYVTWSSPSIPPLRTSGNCAMVTGRTPSRRPLRHSRSVREPAEDANAGRAR